MTREEAIAFFEDMNECTYGNLEAVEMAISALSEELSEDGTLTVHVSDGSKVKRVFVMGDNIFGGLYYPDSVENKGEWEEWKGSRYSGLEFCSNCQRGFPYVAKEYNFCPNCGADMRGEE